MNDMEKPAQLIPALCVDPDERERLVWEDDTPAQGVFLGGGRDDDLLALLGTPTFSIPDGPRLPDDFVIGPALDRWLEQLGRDLDRVAATPGARAELSLGTLDAASRQAALEILGEGEVTGAVTLDGVHYELREAVLAGVWCVTPADGEPRIEVGTIPGVVERAAASLRKAPFAVPNPPAGVMNAPAILAEASAKASAWDGGDNEVINFTLLPMAEQDHEFITGVLGRADLSLKSGGFGDCHVFATTVRHLWAVQYINAMGHVILDTIEIGGLPAAAAAAREDIAESAQRLEDIAGAYRP